MRARRHGQRLPDARDSLSPQELQIAEMAAAGLSNRKIGQRLFLSHRTIESHLYRIYRKPGLTSRVQLAAALNVISAFASIARRLAESCSEQRRAQLTAQRGQDSIGKELNRLPCLLDGHPTDQRV